MESLGVDFAWDKPSIASMKKADVKFVCRYLSRDDSKDITLAEARSYAKAGLWSVVVWETSASRALDGEEAGVQDAREAALKGKMAGLPDSRPIFFAVDFDASADQLYGPVTQYFKGLAQVLPKSRIGAYGGWHTVDLLNRFHRADWFWQTYAWSGGRWHDAAHIKQYRIDVTLGAGTVDWNRTHKIDYGQWMPGNIVPSPPPKKTPPKTKVPVPSGVPNLQIGNRGETVKQLQVALRAVNPSILPPEAVTGFFDIGTLEAVRWFQGWVGFGTRSGLYGPVTAEALRKALATDQ